MTGPRRAFAAGLPTLLLAMALPASANRDADSAAGPRWQGMVSRADRAHLGNVRIYADCMAQRRPAQVDALLKTPIGSQQQSRLLRRLVGSGDCITGSIGIAEHMLRGALAEGRLRERRLPEPAAGQARATDASAVDFAAFRRRHVEAAGGRFEADDEALVRARFAADCVARAQPAAVARLLGTESGSRDELASLRAMSPAIAACAAAAAIDVDRHAMRGALAEAAYGLSSARE